MPEDSDTESGREGTRTYERYAFELANASRGIIFTGALAKQMEAMLDDASLDAEFYDTQDLSTQFATNAVQQSTIEECSPSQQAHLRRMALARSRVHFLMNMVNLGMNDDLPIGWAMTGSECLAGRVNAMEALRSELQSMERSLWTQMEKEGTNGTSPFKEGANDTRAHLQSNHVKREAASYVDNLWGMRLATLPCGGSMFQCTTLELKALLSNDSVSIEGIRDLADTSISTQDARRLFETIAHEEFFCMVFRNPGARGVNATTAGRGVYTSAQDELDVEAFVFKCNTMGCVVPFEGRSASVASVPSSHKLLENIRLSRVHESILWTQFPRPGTW